MTSRRLFLYLFVLSAAWMLGACLGEPSLPALESLPAPTLVSPRVDPTVAAVSRLSLSFADTDLDSNESAPQIPHDLIGRSDCLMCHKQGVGGATRIPDAHRGLESSTCQTCHTAPASAELGGAELYLRLCSRCHGDNGEGTFGPALNTKPFLRAVTDTDLREAVERGRGASEMLAWGDLGLITDRQIDELVALIRGWEATAPERADSIAPEAARATRGDPKEGEALFAQFCSGCHGLSGEAAAEGGFILREVVGTLDDETLSRQIRGGSADMPPFHALLTTNDISDLLALMRTWHAGPLPTPTPILLSGEEAFLRVCARCHGRNGEGGMGPPLNSREFLAANNDEAIRDWIVRGTLGTSMLSWGDLGLLTPDQIDELVGLIRSWEPTAPSTAGATSALEPFSSDGGDAGHGEQLFAQLCSGCHGLVGERQTGGIVLNSSAFLDGFTDEMIASQIQNGGLEMPSFHAILVVQDVNDLLAYMRSGFTGSDTPPGAPSFLADVQPIFTKDCVMCHGSAGGWGSEAYEAVMTTGNNAPVVLPGDPDQSLLAQKLLGTHSIGGIMPPSGPLSDAEIQIIIDWIQAGAPDN